MHKTNRFHVALRLFSDRSQMTSKCDKNISDTLGCALKIMPLYCSYHIIFHYVIYYWTDVRQHGIYLLNLHNVILPDKCNTPVALYETTKVIKWQVIYTVDLFHITYIHMYRYSRKLYLIDLYLPPLGLFRANETNNWSKLTTIISWARRDESSLKSFDVQI